MVLIHLHQTVYSTNSALHALHSIVAVREGAAGPRLGRVLCGSVGRCAVPGTADTKASLKYIRKAHQSHQQTRLSPKETGFVMAFERPDKANDPR